MFLSRAFLPAVVNSFVVLVFTMMIIGSVEAEEKPAICHVTDHYQSSNDVAYQAGIDVHGKAVVPADLNANNFQVPSVIIVPLNIDLAERMSSLVDGLDLTAPLGMIEVHKDGRIVYNGQDWAAPVATLCGQSHKVIIEEEPVLNATDETPVVDGLEGQDVIKSLVDGIEIAPTVAVPPQDVNIKQLEVKPPVEEIIESDIIEGGEHREIFYNE